MLMSKCLDDGIKFFIVCSIPLFCIIKLLAKESPNVLD